MLLQGGLFWWRTTASREGQIVDSGLNEVNETLPALCRFSREIMSQANHLILLVLFIRLVDVVWK